MRLLTTNRVYSALCCTFLTATAVMLTSDERATGQTESAKSSKRVTIAPYTGEPIFLDEKQVSATPSISRRQPLTDKYPDGKTRVERQIAIYSDDRADTDGYIHRESDGFYREFYPNGQKFIDGSYRQGRQHGEWSYFFDNGQLQRKVTFQEGRLHGQWDRFRADGTLAAKHAYEDGVRHGIWQTYDETGKQLLQEEPYARGKLNGTLKAWYANGKPKLQVEIKDGVRNGRSQQWEENGKMQADVTYLDGKLNGTATINRADGTTLVQEYKNGLLVSETK
jgi:antitoxin component YwqK of YwqJK toxin-antitoxin module